VGRLPSRGFAAWRPSPVNGAKSIGTSVVLSWTAGDGATTNDVYFGTALIPDVNEFKGTQTAASYNPGTLSPTGTYYWRIDERSPAGVTRGYRWMFRAGSGPCDMMIPCDEASLRAALEVVGGCSEGGTITFDCSFSTIYISDRIYFNGSNMTLDGEDKKITLRYNGPDLCDQTEGQDHFMALGGSNNTIRNFKLLYFPNGITVTGGSDNIIENLSFPTICESAVINSANKAAGVGTIVRDCLFTGAEGRAVQIGDAVGGSCTVENCQFVNCAKPVSMTSGQNGLYVIRHCLMETNSGSPGYSHGMLGPICKPEVAGGIPNVLFESNVIVNPIDGLGIGGGAATVRAVVRNNVLKNTPAQGVTVKGLVFADDKGSIKLYNNEITDSKAYGVRVSTGGSADLGGGSLGWTMTLTGYAADSASSPGHNLIQNNKVYNVNNATALTYSATGNCWDNSPPVSGDDYSGLWTVTPYNCTGAGTDGTAGLTGAVGPD